MREAESEAKNKLDSEDEERERSRQKYSRSVLKPTSTYLRKPNQVGSASDGLFSFLANSSEQVQKQLGALEHDENELKNELLRSFLRIEQQREEPIDKFVKIVWIYKGKFMYDHRLHDIMKEPGKYIDKLSEQQLRKLLEGSKNHLKIEQIANDGEHNSYWSNLVELIKYQLDRKESKEEFDQIYQQKILQTISKPVPELNKLEKQIKIILKNQSFGSNNEYWEHVLSRIKIKKVETELFQHYQKFQHENADKIHELTHHLLEDAFDEPTSPTLVSYASVNPKLIVKEEDEREARKKLAEKIFREEFEKGRERLEINLSLPHNHGLLSTEIITEQTNTYDTITKQIIEFQKYKRMEEDEEQFNDWVPCETEGRFRDQKPIYLNRVRVSCEWNKYNTMHYTEQNPPPKTIQGYKFNVFYPDLYDKQKTPQYYLENTDDPNYCIIKFKAGPPYKDIAFKILKKEWDFTEKSGFESIFAKGILHLYFNFKKPRFRI